MGDVILLAAAVAVSVGVPVAWFTAQKAFSRELRNYKPHTYEITDESKEAIRDHFKTVDPEVTHGKLPAEVVEKIKPRNRQWQQIKRSLESETE